MRKLNEFEKQRRAFLAEKFRKAKQSKKKLSEREMEELIHRDRVLARKNQIILAKLDNEVDTLARHEARMIIQNHEKDQIIARIGKLTRELLP